MANDAYFGRDLFGFLRGLAAHNNRDCFGHNRHRFEQSVRVPFLRLIQDLQPEMKKINPNIVVDPRPNAGSMMRIYRDIRFSKDKSSYKTFVAAHFWHAQGNEEFQPCYSVQKYAISWRIIGRNEIEPVGKRTRTHLQRSMAHVAGRPIAGSCRTAS